MVVVVAVVVDTHTHLVNSRAREIETYSSR